MHILSSAKYRCVLTCLNGESEKNFKKVCVKFGIPLFIPYFITNC